MKFFYLAPQSAFDSLAGMADHRAVKIGVMSFGFVEFLDESSHQAFLAMPKVTELPHHFSRKTIPVAIVASLSAHGIGAGDGTVDVAAKIAAKFGGLSNHDIFE